MKRAENSTQAWERRGRRRVNEKHCRIEEKGERYFKDRCTGKKARQTPLLPTLGLSLLNVSQSIKILTRPYTSVTIPKRKEPFVWDRGTLMFCWNGNHSRQGICHHCVCVCVCVLIFLSRLSNDCYALYVHAYIYIVYIYAISTIHPSSSEVFQLLNSKRKWEGELVVY